MFVVGRPVNGIPINGLEYAMDDDGNYLLFETEGEAVDFLKTLGIDEEKAWLFGYEIVDYEEVIEHESEDVGALEELGGIKFDDMEG